MSRVLLFFALVVVSLASSAPAAAAYAFSVPRMRMTNTVRPDASVEIEYEIEFENSNYGSAIDVVDIGLPHERYDIGSMEASVDGTRLPSIRKSSYIDIGVEVALGAHAIGTGRSGTFRFRAVMPDMVYSDTTSDDLASFRITPTWFDASVLAGATVLEIAVHLPPGVAPDQVLHQGTAFTHKAILGDTTIVGWRSEATRVDRAHLVGVSFPRASMTRVVVVSRLELLARWFESTPEIRVMSGLLVAVVFGFFFFRFSGGTGWSLFLVLLGVVALVYGSLPRVQLATMPVWLVLAGLMEWRLRRRRRVYLPPLVHVEGGGIKRGLTAPEAAVLLELPLGKVVALALFGMLKKGLVVEVGRDPLRVAARPELKGKNRGERRKAAARLGTVIHGYEHELLDTISLEAATDVTEADFSDALNALVTSVAERVMGFDVEETKQYYRRIVERAWKDAKSVGEVELRTEAVDKKLEWLLIDERSTDSFASWESAGYHYRPVWVRTPGAPSGGAVSLPARSGSGPSGAAPSFGDVSASFAGWTENVTGKLASVISPSSLQSAAGGSVGVVNLSGADKVTGDVLSSFFSGGGGGGGGGGSSGGGCACACAGCACACACAGGGR
jgi:hypothetical protein